MSSRENQHLPLNPYPLVIYSGKRNNNLAAEVAKLLKKRLEPTFYKQFNEGEIMTHQTNTVRDHDVVVIFQVTMNPAHLYTELWESFELIRALKEGMPHRIRIVYPCIPMSRQDRGSKQREFSSFKLLCDLLYAAGADEVYTAHIHNMVTTNFFGQIGSKAKMENISLINFFRGGISKLIKKHKNERFVMGAPDMSAGKGVRAIGDQLNLDTIIVDKKRKPNEITTSVMSVIGDPSDANVIFLDDMISSGGSCRNAADAVRAKGAKKIYMIAAHLVYTSDTWKNLIDGNFEEIWVTDTCVIPEDKVLPNMKILPVAKFLAKVIDNAHNGVSISDLWS